MQKYAAEKKTVKMTKKFSQISKTFILSVV